MTFRNITFPGMEVRPPSFLSEKWYDTCFPPVLRHLSHSQSPFKFSREQLGNHLCQQTGQWFSKIPQQKRFFVQEDFYILNVKIKLSFSYDEKSPKQMQMLTRHTYHFLPTITSHLSTRPCVPLCQVDPEFRFLNPHHSSSASFCACCLARSAISSSDICSYGLSPGASPITQTQTSPSFPRSHCTRLPLPATATKREKKKRGGGKQTCKCRLKFLHKYREKDQKTVVWKQFTIQIKTLEAWRNLRIWPIHHARRGEESVCTFQSI